MSRNFQDWYFERGGQYEDGDPAENYIDAMLGMADERDDE